MLREKQRRQEMKKIGNKVMSMVMLLFFIFLVNVGTSVITQQQVKT